MKIITTTTLLALNCIAPLFAEEAATPTPAQNTKKSWDITQWSVYPFNEPGSFYMGAAAGVSMFGDGAVNVRNNNSGADDFDLDSGYSLALRAGHSFGPLRLEGEFNYVDADITDIESKTGPISVNSNLTTIGVMGNALWDFDFKPFTFTVGAGIGFAHLSYDEMTDQGNVLVADCSDTVFASQLILGISYEINPNTKVGLNYRYVMMGGVDDSGDVDTDMADSSDISFDDIGASIFELSVTYKF